MHNGYHLNETTQFCPICSISFFVGLLWVCVGFVWWSIVRPHHHAMLYVLSQSVWVQACGAVKCCGGLAEDRRQQLVGKRPGASPHNHQWSKTVIQNSMSLLILWLMLCGV